MEHIAVGDEVAARHESEPSGEVEWKPVEACFRRTGRVLHLHFPNGELIRTTPEHTFFVEGEGKGWTQAGSLKAGDRLITLIGDSIPIHEVYDTEEWENVYNIRVADFHTYFVGDEGWSVWAHNLQCLAEIAESLDKRDQLTQEQKQKLRVEDDVFRDKTVTLLRGNRKFSAHIPEWYVEANRQAYLYAANTIAAAAPEVLIAIQNGGALATDVVRALRPDLTAQVVPVLKNASANLDPKMADWTPVREAIWSQVQQGKTKFGIVESWFSGGNRNGLLKALDTVVKRAKNELNVDLVFTVVFLRETIGYEKKAPQNGAQVARSHPGITEHEYRVPMLLGEDVTSIYAENGDRKIKLFNKQGVITQELPADSTSRATFIKLITQT